MTAAAGERIAYNLDEAAELVGLARATLQAAIRGGRLRAKRTGEKRGIYLISHEALTAWFESLEDA